MEGLGEITNILQDFSMEKEQEIFMRIINSNAYKLRSTGVCAAIIMHFSGHEHENEIMYHFLKFLFENSPDKNLSVQLSFLFLWIRKSDETALEYQIQILEEFAPRFKMINGSTNCKLAIAQLIDRCNTYILPDANCSFSETMDSQTFLQKSADFIRSKRASLLRGRLHLITTRILPAFDALGMAKKCAPLEFERDSEDSFTRCLQRIASSPEDMQPPELKSFAAIMNKIDCIENVNREPRPPSRVLTSLNNLSNQTERQDCEVCLQIAIMGLISYPDEPLYVKLVNTFAEKCKVDGNMIVSIIKSAETTYLKKDTLTTKEDISQINTNTVPEIEEPFKPLLEPFDVSDVKMFEEDPKPSNLTTEEKIAEFAGTDQTKWFDGNGLSEWCAARMCVANMMDRLDPDSFSLLPLGDLKCESNDESNFESNNESNHESNDESNHESNHESNDESNHESNDESNHESNDESNHESNDESNHESNDESNHESNDESNHESNDESNHESNDESNHESNDESNHESNRASDQEYDNENDQEYDRDNDQEENAGNKSEEENENE